MVWEAADEVTNQLGLRARSEVMKPLRHALTVWRVRYPACTSQDTANLSTGWPECPDNHDGFGTGEEFRQARSRTRLCESNGRTTRGTNKQCMSYRVCFRLR